MDNKAIGENSPLFKDYCQKFGKLVNGRIRQIKIVIRRLNRAQARELFPNRPAWPGFAESDYGGNSHKKDSKLLDTGAAALCAMCSAPTQHQYLVCNVCPDCDGRAELEGMDPFKIRTR